MTDREKGNSGWIQLVAGSDNQGMPVLEKLAVKYTDDADQFELLSSPLFARDLAAGDVFNCDKNNPADYKVVRRSGNLAIRIFRKESLSALEEFLTPQVEKLDGKLDLQAERALVYSVHVNIGFAAIEKLFDSAMAKFPDSVWYYGNIYDREDGTTPLNWWDEFLNQI